MKQIKRKKYFGFSLIEIYLLSGIFVVICVGFIILAIIINKIMPVHQVIEVLTTITPQFIYTPQSTFTPQSTYTAFPTYTPFPKFTLPPTPETQITLDISPSFPIQSSIPQDINSFKQYLVQNYSSINGKNLGISQINVYDDPKYDFRSVTIIVNEEGAQVLNNQNEKEMKDYGRRLLMDTKIFFNNEECSAYVEYLFYDNYLSTAYFDDKWYYIGDYSTFRDAWPIWRKYIQAYYISGYDDILVSSFMP